MAEPGWFGACLAEAHWEPRSLGLSPPPLWGLLPAHPHLKRAMPGDGPRPGQGVAGGPLLGSPAGRALPPHVLQGGRSRPALACPGRPCRATSFSSTPTLPEKQSSFPWPGAGHVSFPPHRTAPSPSLSPLPGRPCLRHTPSSGLRTWAGQFHIR